MWLSALIMVVIPLIISTLSLGVAGLGNLKRLGRIGLITIVCFLGSDHALDRARPDGDERRRAGPLLDPAVKAQLMETYKGQTEGAMGLSSNALSIDLLVKIVPRNPVAAAASGDMLAVIFFSLMCRRRAHDAAAREGGADGPLPRQPRARHRGDHRAGDEGRADRRLLPDLQRHGAVRVRPAGQPRAVRGDRRRQPGVLPVRRLLRSCWRWWRAAARSSSSARPGSSCSPRSPPRRRTPRCRRPCASPRRSWGSRARSAASCCRSAPP